MKHKITISLALIFFMGSYVSAEEGEKRTGFFAVDFINEFTPADAFAYYDSSFDIQFGGELIPQNTMALGIRVPFEKSGAVLLKYNYDFIRSGNWIPGVSVSALFGITRRKGGPIYISHSSEAELKKLEERNRRFLTVGMNLGVFVKKFISRNIAVLIRTGISHELISVKDPKGIDDLTVNMYIGVGVRWHLL